MKEIQNSLKNNYLQAKQDNKRSLDILENNPNAKINNIVGFQWYRCEKIFLYNLFVEKNLIKAKNELYNAGKCHEFRTKYFGGSL